MKGTIEIVLCSNSIEDEFHFIFLSVPYTNVIGINVLLSHSPVHLPQMGKLQTLAMCELRAKKELINSSKFPLPYTFF